MTSVRVPTTILGELRHAATVCRTYDGREPGCILVGSHVMRALRKEAIQDFHFPGGPGYITVEVEGIPVAEHAKMPLHGICPWIGEPPA